MKNELNSNEPARDVTTAESLLKSHHDLGVDIRAHQDEFNELNQLGEKLLKRNPDFAEVKEKVSLSTPITILSCSEILVTFIFSFLPTLKQQM